MISILSYLVALIITTCLAIVLYPISAVFWLLGQCGKASDVLFSFTTRVIRSLWKDVLETRIKRTSDEVEWTCPCGQKNTGKFCSDCGKQMQYIAEEPPQNL